MHRSTQRDWKHVPDDPDPEEDLGYELIDLDVVSTSDGGPPRLLVLPQDENLLREQAFIVADESAVCDLETKV